MSDPAPGPQARHAGHADPAPEGGARRWSARSIGKKWQHRFFYFLIRYLGLAPAYQWVHIVSFWYVLFHASVRRKTDPYLSRRFPARRGALQRFADSHRLVVSLGKSLVDRAAFGLAGPRKVRIDFIDKEALLAVLGEGRGAVLINAHVGAWQIAVAGFKGLEASVNLVIQRAAGDVDLHYFEHSGESMPFRIIDPEGPMGGIVEMTTALRNGEIVGVMGDRMFGSDANAISAPFMGGTIGIPVSPYRLASAAQAPIIVVFSHRAGRAAYDIRLVKTIRVPPGLGRDPKAYEPWAAEFTSTLEEYVEAHPWEFYNFFDLWRREVRAAS